MTPRRRFLSLLTVSTLCWSTAESCGVLVHNEVLHRATHLFTLPNSNPDLTAVTPIISSLLVSPLHASSFQAGAFFPDWGYQCLSNDDTAEAAHWPPFLVASVEHIVSKYGYLNDTLLRSADEQEHLQGLIAFIFAVAGHQTADATWHAIRLPSGFLAALASVDFGGDVAKAHRVLDFGGEFLLATRLARMDGSRGWIGNEWKVPIRDLIAIYKRVGRDANSFVLRYCMVRGLAALRSGLAVGPSLYDSFASQSPMLLNSLDDYHLGGIDEMSARTVSCWSNLTRWFAHGIGKEEKLRNGWGLCDVFQAIRARGGAGYSAVDGGATEWSRKMGRFGPMGEDIMLRRSEKELARIHVRTDKFGAEIYTLPPLEDKEVATAAPVGKVSPLQVLSSARGPKFQDPTYVATYTPYSHFGASLSVGEFSPSGPALAVGAPHETEDSARPGEGNVYILPLSDLLGSPSVSTTTQPEYLSKSAAGKLQRTGADSGFTDQRFGISTVALNTLGTTLLAIAAPGPYTYDTSSPPSLPFAGTSPAGRIDLFRSGEPSRFLSLSVKGAELGNIGQRWWGKSMISADLDGTGDFLIVSGSSSDGRRDCNGRQHAQMGEGEIGVFQFATATTPTSYSPTTLELTLGEKRIAAAGITVNSWSLTLPESEKSSTTCDRTGTYEYFGRTLAFLAHPRTLLVGAPGAADGAVYAFTLANNTFTHSFTLRAPSRPRGLRSGFGASGLATGLTTSGQAWIAIGAADEAVGADPQAGVVRIYALLTPDPIPQLVAEVVAAVITPTPGRRYGKFGRTIVADAVTGGGAWVGSEFWGGERGAAWWIDVDALVGEARGSDSQTVLVGGEKEGRVVRVEVEVQLEGGEENARFAAAMATGPKGELMVGIPYSGVAGEQETRFYGAVAVFARA